MLCLGSLVVIVVSGLVQVSFGAYSMTIVEAWGAVFNPNVIFSAQAWRGFLLGGALPEMAEESLIVWNIRLPRVFVAMLVGMNLAVSGGIFQAVTRNELASPFILGVSSGAGLMILLTLVVFSGLSTFLRLVAAVGGSVAFLVVYAIAWKKAHRRYGWYWPASSLAPSASRSRRRCSFLPTTSASSRAPSPGPLAP